MPKPPLRNLGASVRARLLNLARARNQSFELLLTRYVLERLLYRLSLTEHRHRFALKGAMLATVWFDDPHRPTGDIDLLGFGDSDADAMLRIFRDVCALAADDAVTFDAAGLRVDRVREELAYGGLRIRTTATVDRARVTVAIDIGFGDATEPGLQEVELPVLLDAPAPRMRAYARETVMAEKFQALVKLGQGNTRMKDFYDLWLLAQTHDFEGDALARAIAATFARRETAIPTEPPVALTRAFADDPVTQLRWKTFVPDVAVNPGPLHEMLDDLAAFLVPHAEQARKLASSESQSTR
jgi:predicted nucleotidyltransferase component of viral defense system